MRAHRMIVIVAVTAMLIGLDHVAASEAASIRVSIGATQ